LVKKLSPPLVTLLSAEPEIQYVALRNMDLIVQKRPTILSRDIRVFFCKYNDPIYVKMEKLEIMIKLSSPDNIEQLLLEFKEYAQAVDVEFVRKSVRAIGRCAIKLDTAAERCVKVLLDLIETKVSYVVQEAVIVIKDIFRRYPNRYEGVIVNLCANLDSLDEPEAKAAMIWIIGEYSERIEDAGERLESWIDAFDDETTEVQLQLLTATVKLFLKRPNVGKDLVKRVLDLATESSDNPDLRDRGFVYWRLLSTDPEAAKRVVLAEKPVISDETFLLDPNVLDVLISNIATLSSVYHKPPESFVRGMKNVVFNPKGDENEEEEEDEEEEEETESPAKTSKTGKSQDDEEEEEGSSEEDERKKPASKGGAVDLLDLGGGSSSKVEFPESKKFSVLPANKGNGLAIVASMTRRGGSGQVILRFQNTSSETLNKFAIQFNKNYLGAAPQNAAVALSSDIAANGGTGQVYVPVELSKPVDEESKQGVVQVALKTQLGVLYFAAPLSAHIFFEENGQVEKKEFISAWKGYPAEVEHKLNIDNVEADLLNADKLTQKLGAVNVFLVTKLDVANKGTCIYASLKYKGETVLCEFVLGSSGLVLSARANNAQNAAICGKSLKFFLTQS
jgi:AP-1 complex subunit beta-1